MDYEKEKENLSGTIKLFKKKNKTKSTQKNNKLKIEKSLILIVLMIVLLILFSNKYFYCYKCIPNINNITSECFTCPNEILYEKLYIASREETLDEIINHNKSISRYGDGEFNLLFGITHYFQKISDKLVNRLLEILNSQEKNCLIGISYPFRKEELDLYIEEEVNFWKKFMNKRKIDLLKLIKQDKKFYSSSISKFYLTLKDKTKSLKYVIKLKKIWDMRDVIIIEGEAVKFGAGNDLLNNAKSIKRIICPSSHSFELYNKIMDAVLKFDKNNLILLSLGPAATVISFDLCKLGYQAVDLGHTDADYEHFIRNASKWILIGGKKISEKDNIIYNKQIINKIMD